MPEKPPRAFADNDHVRLGEALEAGGKVRGLADDARGLIAYYDHSGRDADPHLLRNTRLQSSDRRNKLETGPDRLLRIMLVSVGIAEVHHDAIAHILGDSAAKLAHCFFGAARIGREDISQILRVHAGGERRRPDQIGEHHCDLAAFGLLRS